MTLAAGTCLGPYEIQSVVGAGGMGEVYKATDTRLGRRVAIKVLPPDAARDPERRRRFEQEARAASALNHPHICVLYDVGVQDGIDYLVMEYLEGQTLAERLARGSLPIAQSLEYATAIADALAKAHHEGIVHRDLKPGNIMITKSGAKLLDFGLARLTQSSSASSASVTLSAAGTVVGTVPYMAPEQVQARATDARTDIFAFGAVLYEMLTGRRAFAGGSPASIAAAILEHDAPSASALQPLTPPALDRLVRDCLEKDPDERWQSARDLRRELERIRDHPESTAARSVSGQRVALAGAARHARSRAAALALALCALVAVLVLATFLFFWPAAGPPLASLHQVTFHRGAVLDARFMPDGRNIVYTAGWNDEPPQTFSVQADGIDSVPIPGLNSAAAPAQRVVAVSKRSELALLANDTLSTVLYAAGAPQPVRTGVTSADWTLDSRLAITVRPSTLEFPPGQVIYRTPDWVLSDVRISPRGGVLAVRRHNGNNHGWIDILDAHGKLKTESSRCEDLGAPVWTPDGREVWFAAPDGAAARYAVRAMDLSGRERTVARMFGPVALHDIAADGRVLMTTEDPVINARGLAPGEQVERDLTWYTWSVPDDFSADGRTVLLLEGGESDRMDWSEFLRGTDGSPARRLGEGAFGLLSRDQKMVVTQQVDEQKNTVLALLPTEAGSAQRLDRHNLALPPHSASALLAWLPDGSAFLFLAHESGRADRTWVYRLDGTAPVAVTPEGAVGLFRGLSPDGQSLLVRERAPGRTAAGVTLVEYSMSGGPKTPLPGFDEKKWKFLGWHSDAKLLRVTEAATSQPPIQVWLLDPVTGRAEHWKHVGQAVDRAGFRGLLNPPVMFSDDGGSYVYAYRRNLSKLFVVNGWR